MTAQEILQKRAGLTKQIAALDEQIAQLDELLAAALAPEPDRVLTLAEAAEYVGEPESTFRQRLVYRKALISATTERRLRFSKRALDKIVAGRLDSNVQGER